MISIPFGTWPALLPPSSTNLHDLRRWGVDQLDDVTLRELMQNGEIARSYRQGPSFFDLSFVNRPADRVAFQPTAVTPHTF